MDPNQQDLNDFPGDELGEYYGATDAFRTDSFAVANGYDATLTSSFPADNFAGHYQNNQQDQEFNFNSYPMPTNHNHQQDQEFNFNSYPAPTNHNHQQDQEFNFNSFPAPTNQYIGANQFAMNGQNPPFQQNDHLPSADRPGDNTEHQYQYHHGAANASGSGGNHAAPAQNFAQPGPSTYNLQHSHLNNNATPYQLPGIESVGSFRTYASTGPILAETPATPGQASPQALASSQGNDKVAIPRAGPSTPRHMGPISNKVVVPPRARPGRKPMPKEQQSSKRRQQNREAQRGYRDRRSQALQLAQNELDAARQERQREEGQYRTRIMELERALQESQQSYQTVLQENASLRATNEALTARVDRMERSAAVKHASITHQPAEIGIPTPPEDNWNEIDITETWLKSKSANRHTSNYNVYDMVDPATGNGCGFCTDESNCACKAPQTTPAKKSSGPGTCDMCQQDPARAEACRSLANKTTKSGSEEHSDDKTMSCGQFIDKFIFDTGRMPSIAELFGPLHSYPATNGFNVNEHEAAQVLSDMSRRP